MSLTMAEFQAFGKRTVLSPEETADAEAYYQQHRQMNGLGQAHSGDYRDGLDRLGAAPVTIMWGAGERDPQDMRTAGGGFQQTVMPGAVNRSLAHPRGEVGLERRVALTRMVEELEFLTGTAGVHPRVLAQKVWEARRALVGAGDWSSADYADPRQAYDDKSDLEQRLLVVERLLGVDQLSPRLRMAAGMGVAGLGVWGAPYSDPVEKLASCIRVALCMPKSLCCPPGQRLYPPQPQFMSEGPADTRSLPPAGGTWSPPPTPPLPEETWVQPPPIPFEDPRAQPPPIPFEDPRVQSRVQPPPVTLPPPPIGVIPGTTLKPAVEETKILEMWRPKGNYYGPGSTGQLPHNQTFVRDQTGRAYVAIRDGNTGVFVRFTSPGEAPPWTVGHLAQLNAHLPPLQVVQAPAAVKPVSQTPSSYNELIQALPQAQGPVSQANAAYRNQFIQNTGGRVTGGTAAAYAAGAAGATSAMRAGMFGLGAMPLIGMSSVNDLRAKLRQARQEIARRRA